MPQNSENRASERNLLGALAVLTLMSINAAQAGQGMNPAALPATNASLTQEAVADSVDEALSAAGLARDAAGNLYGTTATGGSHNLGTVYRRAADGTTTILHSFAGGAGDGAAPLGGVNIDSAGNLYGATSAGGGAGCAGGHGCGTIFRITAAGTESILYTFKGGNDGAAPAGNLVLGSGGHLYGTSRDGGAGGCGTVFEISSAGEKKILHAFAASEGFHPLGVLNIDAGGNLYGGTAGLHASLFRLAPDGTLTILLQFA